mgnify:CR=1 FL=1
MFEFQKYLEGFMQTEQLCGLINNVEDFNFKFKNIYLERTFPKINRLGKRVEFLFEEIIKNDKSFELLCSNVQINRKKITIGEIDFIFKKEDTLFHLELTYKFYLFDETLSPKFLNRWIGPNKKDFLKSKLLNLEQNQFPIVHTEEFKKIKSDFSINKPLHQVALIKAQLFIPLKTRSKMPDNFNQCVEGFWLSIKDSELLHDKDQYFIPEKKDWIIKPQENNKWFQKELMIKKVVEYHRRKFSPLVWIKSNEGEYKKFFIVWW